MKNFLHNLIVVFLTLFVWNTFGLILGITFQPQMPLQYLLLSFMLNIVLSVPLALMLAGSVTKLGPKM